MDDYENMIATILDSLQISYARQVSFDNGRFRADFVLIGLDSIVEVDGDSHDPRKDREKDNCYISLGFSVLRLKRKLLHLGADVVASEVRKFIDCASRSCYRDSPETKCAPVVEEYTYYILLDDDEYDYVTKFGDYYSFPELILCENQDH